MITLGQSGVFHSERSVSSFSCLVPLFFMAVFYGQQSTPLFEIVEIIPTEKKKRLIFQAGASEMFLDGNYFMNHFDTSNI